MKFFAFSRFYAEIRETIPIYLCLTPSVIVQLINILSIFFFLMSIKQQLHNILLKDNCFGFSF